MDRKRIYCIPGLGADKRLYSRLELDAELIPIYWVEANETDSISDYAKKLLPQIKDINPTIMGVSLGGILAVEISKLIICDQLILISTIKSKKELPPYFSIVDRLPFKLNKAADWFKVHGDFLKPIYNKTNKEDLELFKAMLHDADANFLNWGVNAVAHWSFEEEIETPYIHIHGTMDLVFPTRWIENFNPIKNGSHYMIVDKSDQVSDAIAKALKL